MVERRPVKARVEGSSPSPAAIQFMENHTDTMNAVETQRFQAFEKSHRETCPVKFGGPIWDITYRHNGIGTFVEVTCPNCGKTEDVTDYDSF